MYGMPKNFPFDKLEGAQVLQICYGENEVIINFTNEISILIMSRIKIEGDMILNIETFKENCIYINEFIGKIITSSSWLSEGIRISFGDRSIIIIDDSEEFESFIISISQCRYVI